MTDGKRAKLRIDNQAESGWRRFLNGAPLAKADQGAPHGSTQLTQLARLFEQSETGWFWSVDQNLRLTYLSPEVAAKLGRAPEDLLGQPFQTLFQTKSEDGGSDTRTLPFVLGKRGKFSHLELQAASEDQECWWSVSGQPINGRGEDFAGFHGNALEVTARRHITAVSDRLASSDSLTGLASRSKMAQRLTATLTAYRVAKRSCALMMIDLDRFKQVNDTLGHQAGDELLKQASQRLTKVVNANCEIGRIGGDEFQVILPDTDDRGRLGEIAARIIAIVSQPYTIDGVRCVIGASAGVAIAPYDGIDSDELIRSADLALYAAKNGGRGRFRFYSSDLHDEAESRRRIEDDLRDALARREISLTYQPILDVQTNQISGFDALMHWDHPQRGVVPPEIFLPIAEEANLSGDLGEWALRQACQDAAAWTGSARVAVKITPAQFQRDGLAALVTSALGNSGLVPDRLELEVSEGVFMGENAQTEARFERLKQLGVRLALDDFGIGYSSLANLASSPFDKIKIDKTFLRDAAKADKRNSALISAIVSLADALDMEVTAEGVETLDTLALIRKLKVSHAQGDVYSGPLTGEDITDRLARGDLVIQPTGPSSTRSDRRTLFRRVGLIHEDHRYEVTMKNLSKSGALIEGLLDVPVGTKFVLDFGEGQLAVSTVVRSHGNVQGLSFEVPLVSDGADGLCTRYRVSPYSLAAAGMPLAALPPGQYPLTENGQISADRPRSASLPAFTQTDRTASSWKVA